ncbi:MAG: NAD-dependent DNA ligase LigA [Clostridia bacterium]|nr:NAD-dependent DNA ligase LigA [Clostridia bacterium]
MDNYSRMKELVDLLNKYASLYYEQDAPVVSDAEYDALYDELRRLEESEGYSLKNSPTHRVGGAPQKKFEQSKHLRRLYSLDKCQSIEEFYEWCARTEKVVSPLPTLTAEYKFDGLTLNLLYDNGKLVQATTRGDGVTGEIVTAQVRTISKLPREIEYKGKIEIQGEGILRLSNFNKYNLTAVEPLKNARNGVAGAIRNLNPAVTAERNISFFAYNVGYSDKTFETQKDIRDFLIEQGFETEGDFALVGTREEIEEYINRAEKMRGGLDYLIDGLVFKVNNLAYRDELGYTEKFPKWAIAYKFKADEMTTTLNDVVWQVSRSAKLNPLAVLEPVDIGGVTVKKATLNNYGDILRKNVKIGDRVFIRRSNDVIPEIMGVAETYDHSKQVEKPTVCPACGAPVKEVGAFLYCTGEHCAPQVISALDHFASKDAMDIEGFSEKTAEQFYNEIGLRTLVDLMNLKPEDMFGLEGFGDKKISNLIGSIEKSKKTTADRFLYALGVDGIGKKTAKDLIKRFRTLKNLAEATEDELASVDGIGGILAKNIVDYFSDEGNRKLVADLLESGIILEEKEEIDGALKGLKFVLTGSLPTLKRGEATLLIEQNGGEVASSVSKTVDIVLAGEDAGSKLQKAEKLGIKIISEDEFLSMIGK